MTLCGTDPVTGLYFGKRPKLEVSLLNLIEDVYHSICYHEKRPGILMTKSLCEKGLQCRIIQNVVSVLPRY